MITVCLDESGTFEGKGSPVKIIGGLIYRGAYEDFETEKINIERFLKYQCVSLGLLYPSGIHVMEMRDSGKKFKLKEAVKQYIKKNGKYYMTLIIRSRDLRSTYKNSSNVVSDSVASNLYEHMIWNLLNNILFYNLDFQEENQVVLEIATRSIPIPNNNREEIEKYKKLGYSFRTDDDETIFYLTDQRTFKAAISTKMLEDEIKKNIDTDFNVQSINYYRTRKDRERETTPWLYLADITCDIIREYINPSRIDFNIGKLDEEGRKITGNKALFWAYDDMDGWWNGLYESFGKRDYIGCLRYLFRIQNEDSPFKKYYETRWVSGIRESLSSIFDVEDFSNYVDEVRRLLAKDTANSEENQKDNNMGLYIGEEILREVKKVMAESIDTHLKYRLADLMLMGYNHRGNIEKAREFLNICKSMRGSVEPEDYCGTLLNVAQVRANEFDYDGAIAVIKDNERYVGKLKNIKLEFMNSFEEESSPVGLKFKYPLLGKVFSSMGQFYSFKREKDMALMYFEKALCEFEAPSSNRDITMSYLLHLALDFKDRDIYERYAKEYLDSESLSGQLENIIERQDRFKLFVFVKSLNTFYSRVDTKVLDILKNTNWGEREAFITSSHPWELIYKHLSILFYRHNDRETGELFKDSIDTIIKGSSDLTLMLVSLFSGLYICYYYGKDMGKVREKITEFRDKARENDTVMRYFEDCFEKDDIELSVKCLCRKFTYNNV